MMLAKKEEDDDMISAKSVESDKIRFDDIGDTASFSELCRDDFMNALMRMNLKENEV